MNGTQNLNLNECFKEITNIGSTTYQNICTGTTSTVPWGVGDWFLGLIVGVVLMIPILILVVAVIDTIKN